MKVSLKKPEPRLWLTLVGVVSIIALMSYAVVQQSTRLDANNLPIQMSDTIAAKLSSGSSPADVIPLIPSSLGNDSIPFAIITDSNLNILASSAKLGGQQVLPPKGTFNFKVGQGGHSFTWEPAPYAREATHIAKYDKGYIVTGQSLKEPEHQIAIYGLITLFFWLVAIAWISFALSLKLKPAKK